VAGVVVLLKQVLPEELVVLAVEAMEALVLEQAQTAILILVEAEVVVERIITAAGETVVQEL
jgi:hypothetical protein